MSVDGDEIWALYLAESRLVSKGYTFKFSITPTTNNLKVTLNLANGQPISG